MPARRREAERFSEREFAFVHAFTRIHKHAHVHARTHIHTHTHMYTYNHTYMHICTHIHTHGAESDYRGQSTDRRVGWVLRFVQKSTFVRNNFKINQSS